MAMSVRKKSAIALSTVLLGTTAVVFAPAFFAQRSITAFCVGLGPGTPLAEVRARAAAVRYGMGKQEDGTWVIEHPRSMGRATCTVRFDDAGKLAAPGVVGLTPGAAVGAAGDGAGAAGAGGASSTGEALASQLASRVELHALPSLTLTDAQVLTGDSQGKPVTLAAELRLSAKPGRQPAVVLLHGSGGVGSNAEAWTRELTAMGVATLVVDGFTGRGLVSTGQNQGQLGRLNFIVDAYRALDLLSHHPRIDASRVALMGFSRGGQAALLASLTRFHRLWNPGGSAFAAYLPFYPDCSMQLLEDTALAGPVRIHHGAADDYNPVASCEAYVARLQQAGQDVKLATYEGAPHGFDAPLGPVPPAVAEGAQTVRRCMIREDAPGRLLDTATGQPFTYADPCVELGPHVGYDAAATRAAHEAVRAQLNALFKL